MPTFLPEESQQVFIVSIAKDRKAIVKSGSHSIVRRARMSLYPDNVFMTCNGHIKVPRRYHTHGAQRTSHVVIGIFVTRLLHSS